MKRTFFAILGMTAAVITGFVAVFAQDAPLPLIVPGDVCADPYALSLLNASDACVGKPFGYICNAGPQPLVEPPGPVANSLTTIGALVETGVVQSVRTLPIEARGAYAGLAFLRVAVENTPVIYSGLLIGDVSVRNVTPPEFPAWQSFIVQTTDPAEQCETAPFSTFVAQNPIASQSARLVINGVSIDLNGTLAVQTTATETFFFTLSGEVGALAGGQRQRAVAGQEMSAIHLNGDFSRPEGVVTVPRPFRQDRVNHLPLPLFDRPIQIAQGGVATTAGPVNLRTAPTTDAAILLQTPAQTRVTLLGRNDDATWYHVRLSGGETGWMLGELLIGDFSQVANTYVATPQPVQRLGDVGAKAHIIAPSGFDLRAAPDLAFQVVNYLPAGTEVTLIAHSPYSPWVNIEAGTVRGWIPLLALETRAIVTALPIDYDVPPPPEPTRIPGTFGNAFPDPSCYPNC